MQFSREIERKFLKIAFNCISVVAPRVPHLDSMYILFAKIFFLDLTFIDLDPPNCRRLKTDADDGVTEENSYPAVDSDASEQLESCVHSYKKQ